MREIIKGKVYNTDSSRLIFNYKESVRDPSELLYQKRTGEYFMLVVWPSGVEKIEPWTLERVKYYVKIRSPIFFNTWFKESE